MAESRRIQRSEKELRNRVAEYLVSGFKHPLFGLVTVSHVEMSPDLKWADVYISVLGSPEDKRRSLESLGDHMFDIQQYIRKNWVAKFIPRLRLHEDQGAEEVHKVQNILKHLRTSSPSEGDVE